MFFPMEQRYMVSARKYRPAKFGDVVGQTALTTTLRNAIANGKLAHAYLFCGPRGVGKTTCARIFAKNINCLNPANGEACEVCESCKSFNEGRSMNIYELDAASNNSVDDIRMITEQVQVPPQIGKYKVYIIDEVHMLSTAAFNAFLKTLEEPPSYVIFILATTEKHKLLPTILSRCQIYDFNRMEAPGIVSYLKYVAASEGIEAEDEALNVIARKADGGMRDALSIFDQVASYGNGKVTYQGTLSNLNVIDYDVYFKAVELVMNKDVPNLLMLLDSVVKKGFDPGQFIGGLSEHLRDLLVSRDKVTLPLLEVPDDARKRYHEQAMRLTQDFICNALKLANECDTRYKQSRNKRLQVELALIMIAQMGDDGDDTSSGQRPQEIKPVFAQGKVQQGVQEQIPAKTPEEKTTVAASHAVAAESQPAYTIASKPPKGRKSFSIKIENEKHEKDRISQSQSDGKDAVSDAGGYQDLPIDENELGVQWRLFANKMPMEEKAVSARMLNMTPKLLSDTVFEIKVETERVKEMLMAFKKEIVSTLRRELKNSKIDMQVTVMDLSQVKIAVSPKEKFNELQAKNPDIADLVRTFDLCLE